MVSRWLRTQAKLKHILLKIQRGCDFVCVLNPLGQEISDITEVWSIPCKTLFLYHSESCVFPYYHEKYILKTPLLCNEQNAMEEGQISQLASVFSSCKSLKSSDFLLVFILKNSYGFKKLISMQLNKRNKSNPLYFLRFVNNSCRNLHSSSHPTENMIYFKGQRQNCYSLHGSARGATSAHSYPRRMCIGKGKRENFLGWSSYVLAGFSLLHFLYGNIQSCHTLQKTT